MAALQTRRLSLRMHCAHDAPRRWGKLPVRQFRRKLRETWLTTERHIHIYNIDTYIHRHIYTYIHVYVDRHIIAPWPDTSQWSKPDKAPSTKCYKLIPTCSVRGLWIYVYVCWSICVCKKWPFPLCVHLFTVTEATSASSLTSVWETSLSNSHHCTKTSLVRVWSDHSIISIQSGKRKTKKRVNISLFCFFVCTKHWRCFSYFQPKTENRNEIMNRIYIFRYCFLWYISAVWPRFVHSQCIVWYLWSLMFSIKHWWEKEKKNLRKICFKQVLN